MRLLVSSLYSSSHYKIDICPCRKNEIEKLIASTPGGTIMNQREVKLDKISSTLLRTFQILYLARLGMDDLDMLSGRNLGLTKLGKDNAHPKLRHGLPLERYVHTLCMQIIVCCKTQSRSISFLEINCLVTSFIKRLILR